MVKGRSPSTTVIVGWDNPLTTFFAQVWETEPGAVHYEDGDLLLWAGAAFDELPSTEALAEVLAAHVRLPDGLRHRLECDRTNAILGLPTQQEQERK